LEFAAPNPKFQAPIPKQFQLTKCPYRMLCYEVLQSGMLQNSAARGTGQLVTFGYFNISICLGFRYWDLELNAQTQVPLLGV
jgi:hypothetical protein